jgi:acyl-CoA reductase-like NAD-dependent aldehyde dehydrogenase
LNGYGKEARAAVTTYLGIDKVVFTGSIGIGKDTMKHWRLMGSCHFFRYETSN